MKLHRLHTVQRLPVSMDEAWSFFSRPENLQHITPGWLDFLVTSDGPDDIYPGTIITYTIRPVLGIKMRWVTEITHVDAPHRFVDEQRFGPYRFWHHQHHFRPVEGGVEVKDCVHYALPFGPFGRLAHTLAIHRQLDTIFAFRRDVLEERFGIWQPVTSAA